MRILYCDPSLTTTLGHHYNVAVRLIDAMRRQGHEVRLAISKSAEVGIDGQRCFRKSVYNTIYWDPASNLGRTLIARTAVNAGRDIWPELENFRPDLIYAHSVDACACEGILAAIGARYYPGAGPVFVAELGGFPWESRENCFYGEQLRALFALLRRKERYKQTTFYPLTVNRETSRHLSRATGRTIATLPSPYMAAGKRRSMGKNTPLKIGIVGHQSRSKGFHLLPEIIDALSPGPRLIEFIVQVQTGSMDEIIDALRSRHLQGSPIRIIEGAMNDSEYFNLLQSLDIVLLPYEPEYYATATSGIAYEALGQGSVIVAPKQTTVGEIVQTYQLNARLFSEWTAHSIADSLRSAVEDFEQLLQEALEGAEAYGSENGPDCYVSELVHKFGRVTSPRIRSEFAGRVSRRALKMKSLGLKVRLQILGGS